MTDKRNYTPTTIEEYFMEIRIYEKYFKRYTKQLEGMRPSVNHDPEAHQLEQQLVNIRRKLIILYAKYNELIADSKGSKIQLIYKSKA